MNNKHSKRILLLTPIPSHPQIAGNRARIFNLARSITALGHELFFAHIEFESGDASAMQEHWGADHFFSIPYKKRTKLADRIKKKLIRLVHKDAKYTTFIDGWYDDRIDIYLRGLHQQYQFDAMIVEYVFFSKALLCLPKQVKKIIDTHDVMTDRHKMYLRNGKPYNWFSTTAAQERKAIKRADTVVAIQENECNFFKQLGAKEVISVGHTVKTTQKPIDESPKNRILFIGSANQSNIDALRWFIEQIFPVVRKSIPESKLLIAGPVGRVVQPTGDAFVNLGEPSSLDKIYNQTDIVINPIQIGTGLKIKNIEALGYAKPLVTTTIGAEGMRSGIDSVFKVADNSQEFSSHVIDILRDPLLYHRLSSAGYDFALAWNQKQMESLVSVLA